MARYIDADLILPHIEEEIALCKELEAVDVTASANRVSLQVARSYIVTAPTADVAEVKHGEWELKSETLRFLEEIDEEFYVECPFCHRVYYIPFEFEDEKMLEYARKNYPYCNCGAKMDGGKTG